MSKPQIGATARVTMTVEMPAGSSWGTDCTVAQIHDQAGRETQAKLANILREHGGKIIGEPKVVAVFAER